MDMTFSGPTADHHIVTQNTFEDYSDFFNKLGLGPEDITNKVTLPRSQWEADLMGVSPHGGGHLGSYTQPLEDITRNAEKMVGSLGPDIDPAVVEHLRDSFTGLQGEMRAGLLEGTLSGVADH